MEHLVQVPWEVWVSFIMFKKTKTISTHIWAGGREWVGEWAGEFGECKLQIIDSPIVALVNFDVIMALSRQAFPVTDHQNISFVGHKVTVESFLENLISKLFKVIHKKMEAVVT